MFFGILQFIGIVVAVVVIFNILIIVHELGHFLAALWRGLVVEKFAIWFGKPLWKKEINGVEYILGSIPAGGYVALPQMAPMEALEGGSKVDKEKLKEASPLDKIIVAFAGPLFSFGLALVFACIVWVVGKPVSDIAATTTVGYVPEQVLDLSIEPTKDNPIPLMGNSAYQEGLRTGDQLVEVDGLPVSKRFGLGDSIQWRFIRSEGDKIPVTVLRDGKRVSFDLTPIYEDKKFYQRGALRMPPFGPPVAPRVGSFIPGSPADKAGLKPGDVIVAINGEPIEYFSQVNEFVREHPEITATYTVRRSVGGEDSGKFTEETVQMAPETPVEYYGKEFPPPMLGIQWQLKPEIYLQKPGPNPFVQVGDSVMAVVNTIDAVISPSSVGVSHLSGPIGIMNIYGRMLASEYGWQLVLWMSVVINVNLALVNLLPLPVLDGGHITFAIIEWIRRRPVSIRMLEALNGATALLLIGFMLYVTFFDLQELVGLGQSGQGTIRFSDTPAQVESGKP